MRIGAAWQKQDKNQKTYYSISIDKAIKPLVIDDTKTLALFPNEHKTESKHPDFVLCMDVKEPKEETPAEESGNNTDFLWQ